MKFFLDCQRSVSLRLTSKALLLGFAQEEEKRAGWVLSGWRKGCCGCRFTEGFSHYRTSFLLPFLGRGQERQIPFLGSDRYHQFCCCLAPKLCRALWQPPAPQPARVLCPWDFPGKNTGVSCHACLQGIFPTQGSNPTFPALLADGLFTEPPVLQEH